MPRTSDPRRQPSGGIEAGWAALIDLLTAIGVWAAIGFGLDHAFGTYPILMAVGMVLGAAAGIYMIYRRASDSSGAKPGALKPGQGVTRRAWPAIGDGGVSSRERGEE